LLLDDLGAFALPAKVAGTEKGVKEPAATFSACFGAPFMVRHPFVYAQLLAKKIKEHRAN
jgi:phosphoenolpyruvate carboxykinase (ATP)